MKMRYILIICILVGCIGCSEKNVIEDSALAQVVEQVWPATDSAMAGWQQINAQALNDYDYHRYRLAEAHLRLKHGAKLPTELDMVALAEYFANRGDMASAGEAYYIQGAYLNWLGQNTEAMHILKDAESHPTAPIIRGMTYYKMGRISESEQLYDIALENYQNALPYLETAGLPLYLASVYRELGRMSNAENRNSYFDNALVQAKRYGDTILYLDTRYAQLAANQSQSPELAQICQYLCHQAGQKRYAYDLVKYYIRSQKADSARIYLDLLSADTTAQIWSKQQYVLWNSQYLRLKGKHKEAYNELYQLYNENYSVMEEKGRASTFVVSEHYDNEVEHAKNLQLQLEKQRLYMVLILVLAAILLATILLILLSARRRTIRLVEKARTEQKIKDLHKELQLRREALKQVLDQRLALNKSLQEALLLKKEEERIPDWAQQFIDSNVLANDVEWEHFFSEFNGCYGNLIQRLQSEYPRLTQTDTQVLALYVLGMDNSDICLLMGLTQRTIWSRRMRIKSRVGLSEKESLDKWLEKEVKKG